MEKFLKFENLGKILTLSIFCLYLFGFITWNYFLGYFGFFEYNVLQTRYISAGVLFCILILIPSLYIFILIHNKFAGFIYKRAVDRVLVLLFFIIWYLFLEFVFPVIPPSWGGGRPEVISLLGTPEQITYLKQFNILGAENGEGKPSVQTMKLCSLYQNKEFLIMGVPDTEDILKGNPMGARRVIVLRQDQVLGFEALPPRIAIDFRRKLCGPFFRIFYFSDLLTLFR